ncbi:FAD-dependent pyridine nucleotide-disulfide oxidoreductase [Nitritalea halalkaliphila LW7]|uniref:FAD-dependent pyridine nucleotide-disulfide oxidoreductase n=1 Tax=Nitritalea halalkaliphila LW7 TaxID=1189621 RepID=I5C2L1_9BACT|nr:FAD-dependent oxidoreductase [Nitritalea halalkaliphila]EIM76063.1 FAD-dependent pyridine nucleotide-disulfide oxidoreductase [Nitritalea halalkaliphila LW7]
MSRKNKHLVIIGNGIAGVTCARHVRRYDPDIRITLISEESAHFYSRTALMYIYMGHMTYAHTKPYEDSFWPKNRLELLQARVESVHPKEKVLRLKGQESPFSYDILVIASGSRPRMLPVPGSEGPGVQGLYHLQDLERLEAMSPYLKQAVLIGGGLIGVEWAEMLLSRGVQVHFLVREKHFWNTVLDAREGQLLDRHLREHGVQLHLETEASEILRDATGQVSAVRTSKGELLPAQLAGISIGVTPNIDFLEGSGIVCGRGVRVDALNRTSEADIYAIGDCAEFQEAPAPGRKTLEQVWYTGRMQGEALAHTLCHPEDPSPYKPGPWFNSAKFFDIEYQTYGDVPAELRAGEQDLYWEHPEGKIALRLLFSQEASSDAVPRFLGVNSFGWRLRHAYFDQALRAGYPITRVLEELESASFDAEFSPRHAPKVRAAFRAATGLAVREPRKKSFFRFLFSS